MITIPTAVHSEAFKWQLDLFWFGHCCVYGASAPAKAHAVVIKRNEPSVPKVERLEWDSSIPHTMCESFFDIGLIEFKSIRLPLNIQAGLAQVLPTFSDDAVLEVVDCDMLHFRPCQQRVNNNELVVSDVYENWHLLSLTDNRGVIDRYFENGGAYYNGGFVPIIGKAKTFRVILREWIAIHVDILRRPHNDLVHWWAGMFALQAACEKAKVQMIGRDCCYVPGITKLTATQHVGHYSVDNLLNKRKYPKLDASSFDVCNPFYATIRAWFAAYAREIEH
jgi:hypothetical protein